MRRIADAPTLPPVEGSTGPVAEPQAIPTITSASEQQPAPVRRDLRQHVTRLDSGHGESPRGRPEGSQLIFLLRQLARAGPPTAGAYRCFVDGDAPGVIEFRGGSADAPPSPTRPSMLRRGPSPQDADSPQTTGLTIWPQPLDASSPASRVSVGLHRRVGTGLANGATSGDCLGSWEYLWTERTISTTRYLKGTKPGFACKLSKTRYS